MKPAIPFLALGLFSATASAGFVSAHFDSKRLRGQMEDLIVRQEHLEDNLADLRVQIDEKNAIIDQMSSAIKYVRQPVTSPRSHGQVTVRSVDTVKKSPQAHAKK